MKIVSLTLADANAFVEQHHRHSKKVQGHKFSIGAVVDGQLVGVAIVGRPVARKLDDGLTLEVTRCCVLDDAPKGSCSFLYRRAWRIWAAMGGERLITYTLDIETGSSLRGAGFVELARSPAWKEGKGWTTRQNRQWQPVHQHGKIRWGIAVESPVQIPLRQAIKNEGEIAAQELSRKNEAGSMIYGADTNMAQSPESSVTTDAISASVRS